MVALGNNRNNGSNLGAFYLNANNALGNSNGNNWRSRASSALKQELSNFLSPSQLCNTTQGARIAASTGRRFAFGDGCVYMDNFHFFASSRAPLHRLQKFAVKVLAEYGMEMKPDWQIFPVKDRGVRIAGIVEKSRGTNRLYDRTFHRMMAAISRAFRRPNKKNLNSVMAYLGWLMATGRIRIICDKIKKEKIKCRCTLIQKFVQTN